MNIIDYFKLYDFDLILSIESVWELIILLPNGLVADDEEQDPRSREYWLLENIKYYCLFFFQILNIRIYIRHKLTYISQWKKEKKNRKLRPRRHTDIIFNFICKGNNNNNNSTSKSNNKKIMYNLLGKYIVSRWINEYCCCCCCCSTKTKAHSWIGARCAVWKVYS